MTPADAWAKAPLSPAEGEHAAQDALAAGAAVRPARVESLRPGVPADGPAVIADAVKIVAWLSLAAGVIHALAMVDHFAHWWLYGVFFLVLTYGQVLWGVALLRKPVTVRSLRIGATANLAIVAIWLFSRTVGVPIGPEAGSAEPVGVMDAAATFDQLLLVAYVGLIVRPGLRAVRGLRSLIGVHRVRIGMMVCSVSVFASLLGGHSH